MKVVGFVWSLLRVGPSRFFCRWALIFVVTPLLPGLVQGQGRINITEGRIDFTSNAQLELIKASSDNVQGIINPLTQQFAFSIDIKSFRGFNSELQREHFNEKYMESDSYPKGTFNGKIIEQVDFSTDGIHEVRAKGELDIHGQKQTRIIRSTIAIQNGTVVVESNFMVPLADHNIAIPNIVSQKIATEIEVDFRATMKFQ